jgi:hypothetical protein
MRKVLDSLKGVIWTAVFALGFSLATLVAGVAGADTSVVLGLGLYSLVMAILTPKS